MNEEVKVTFIIPTDCRNENECSEDMQLAFVAAEQHSGGGIQSKWVHESLVKSLEDITKRDVFVLSEFKGEIFDKLRKTKCLVVGPRCLACCLTEGTAIPSGPEPVYTVAMRDLMVTASGLTKEKKEIIKKKVHWMGGIYNTAMTVDTTHLISDTVLSEKYIKSVEKGIPVMSETWVEAVWEASLRLNINGSSADFDAHRLPTFANLQITTSGIAKRDKQIIMKLVNDHGGTFSGAFQSETTDVVVLTKEGIGSEKYKAAMEYGKVCVLPAWVKDSAARGVALPVTRYKITGASTSSPLAEHRLPDMSLNFSRITNSRPPSNFVDETRSTDVSTMSTKIKFSQEMKKSNDSMDKDIQMAFENFDMSLIKKAGPIFDGFCIWVCGVEGVHRERCAACVSRCGGVRYDAAAARVTHAVAGTPASAHAASSALPAVPVLSPLWLLRSVEAGRALEEADFVIDVKPKTPMKCSGRKLQTDVASPMSKRNLQLLRRGPLDLPPPGPAPAPAPPDHLDIEPHEDLVNHYLSQDVQQNLSTPKKQNPEEPGPRAEETTLREERPDITEDLGDEPTEEIEQIFRGMKIEVQGLDDEAVIEIGAEVGAAGGVLAAGGAGGSHVLVPLDFDPEDLITKHAEPVTVFWVKECLSEQELVEIQYYHRPVQVPQWGTEPPLRGVVASLSTYSGVERAFLDELAKLLGATTQLRFCRRNTTNAIASTHLICPTASGDKYAGAVKWGLPAVRASWLLDCLKQGRRVSEREHLVGDTKAPSLTDDIEEGVEPVEQEKEETSKATDKENTMLPPVEANIPRRGSMPAVEKTPIGKHLSDGDEMSPASRYIAMARQGLLGGDSQETPKRVNQLKQDDKQGGGSGDGFRTPPIEDALSSPNLMGFSPSTRRRLQAIRRGEMPSGPIRTPTDPFERNVETPDSEFGCALAPDSGRLSPESRKRLWRLVNELPSKQPDPVRDKHTPLSEIRNRFLAQYGGESSTGHIGASRKLQLLDSPDTPPAKLLKLSDNRVGGAAGNVTYEELKGRTESSAASAASEAGSLVEVQLQRLDEALAGRFSSQRARRPTRDSLNAPQPPPPLPPGQDTEFGPESQPNTVGWDDTTPAPPLDPPPTKNIKRFMLSSNVDNREEVIEMIQHLGGEVSEGAELDPEATHLLCAVPGRSEKMLGSIAAGRWVLHPAYIARSRQANKFLPEEEFEWGNPLATCLPGVAGPERVLARAAHRWRSGREGGAPGAFDGVVALLHVPPPRRRLLARLVTAGGGLAPDDEPPYSNETVTVCFADIKRYPLSSRDARWLTSRRIPVCAPVLLSSYLTDDVPPRPDQHCLPEYRPAST